MKILNKKLVEEAAVVYAQTKSKERFSSLGNLLKEAEGFMFGVEWAESQMEGLMVEFLKFYMFGDHPFDKDVFCVNENKGKLHDDNGTFITIEELFQQFLKERDE